MRLHQSALDESKSLDLLVPSACLPVRRRSGFGLNDDRLKADRSSGSHPSLGRLKELGPQTESAEGWSDRQPIDSSSPAVPSGDDRTDDDTTILGNDQCRWVVVNLLAQALGIVGMGGFSLSLSPEGKNGVDIGEGSSSKGPRHVHRLRLS